MTREKIIDRLREIKQTAENNVYTADLSDGCNNREDLESALRLYMYGVESLIEDLGE